VPRLALVALVGLVVAALSYVLAVRTGTGQRAEDLAFEGRKALELRPRRVLVAVMRLLVPAVVVSGLGATVVLSYRRGGWRLAAWLAGGGALAVLLAAELKASVPRPALAELLYASPANSFPSGHASLLTAVLAALVVAAPDGARWRILVRGGAGVTVLLIAVLVSGWHRPSDVLGGMATALTVVCAAAAGAALTGSPLAGAGGTVDAGGQMSPSPRRVLAVGAVAWSFAVVVAKGPSNPAHDWFMFVVVATVVLGVAAGLLGLLWWALQGEGGVGPPEDPRR
jgi:hypothetical protein